jgi:3-oxoadipate enol-lactonase
MRFRGNGIEIHYELTGPAAGDVVTLSHALLADSRMWDRQMDALADFRVLRYDLRGHGQSQSSSGEYSLALLAADLLALLDELQIESTHFVGCSIGAMIGLELATTVPDRLATLTLCDTRAGTGAARTAWRRQNIESAKVEGVGSLVAPTLESWFSDAFRRKSGQAVNEAASMIEGTSLNGLIGCSHAIETQSHHSLLGQIKLPCLIVVGEGDSITPVNEAFDLHVGIDGSDMVVIPKARHLSNVESASEFNDVLITFLKQYS